MWLLFVIVLWYPSLAAEDILSNIGRRHNLTMVKRGEGMLVFLLTKQSIRQVKSTIADMMQ